MAKNEMKLWWLVTGALLSSIGMSFIWPLTSVYLHNRLGISLTMIGIVLLFNSLASVLGSYLGGYLYDRKNPYHLLIGGVIGAIITLIILIFFHEWPAFGIILFFNGIAGGWNLTIVNSIGTSIKSQDSRYVFNMLYFAQNLGVVIGTSLVGFVYSISVTLLFVIATCLFLFFLIVVIFKYRPAANVTRKRADDGSISKYDKKQLPQPNALLLTTLFVSLLIIWTMYQQWDSNLSVYMTTLGIPLRDYSFLWTINAGLIVVIQLIVNWVAHYHENLIIQILFGIFMVAISFVTLIFAKSYLYFVVSMITLTIGEATAFPTIPALVNSLTPVEAKGLYQGLISSWAAAGRALGPLFGGIIIEAVSYTSLFVIASVAIFLVLLSVALVWRLLQAKLIIYR
ncbi:MAG: MFS transporter [Lentilactobacillus diolivorans]|uniref:MDR family MFS transporter n=1 Tax=Lentilactobacillus diolivorans TaxID=179838 RepID=UPI0039EA2269